MQKHVCCGYVGSRLLRRDCCCKFPFTMAKAMKAMKAPKSPETRRRELLQAAKSAPAKPAAPAPAMKAMKAMKVKKAMKAEIVTSVGKYYRVLKGPGKIPVDDSKNQRGSNIHRNVFVQTRWTVPFPSVASTRRSGHHNVHCVASTRRMGHCDVHCVASTRRNFMKRKAADALDITMSKRGWRAGWAGGRRREKRQRAARGSTPRGPCRARSTRPGPMPEEVGVGTIGAWTCVPRSPLAAAGFASSRSSQIMICVCCQLTRSEIRRDVQLGSRTN